MVPAQLGCETDVVRRSVILGLLLGLCACSGADEGDASAQVDLLAAEGAYAVGYRTLEVEYPNPVGGQTRRLTALAWYPAEPKPDGEDPIYLLRTPELAKVDATPLALGPRPLVLLSHGHQAYPAGQSFLAEHLASHGFVVVAPTHTGNTFVDGDDRETDIYYLRAHDVSRTLDALIALDDDLGALIGDKVAVVGHSFGGYTGFMLAGARHDMDTLAPACAAGTGNAAFCSTMTPDKEAVFRAGLGDARISALVSLDPGDFELFGAAGVGAVQMPVLHMVAEQSGFAPGQSEADDYWVNLSNPADVRVLLLGGGHNDFTDSCAAGLDIRCSDLPARPVWRLVRVYVQAFLLATLEGRSDVAPILDGSVDVSELAELAAR